MKDTKYGKIDFVGKVKLFTFVSVALVIASIVLIVVKGLNYGIDFAGGTEVQVLFKTDVDATQIRDEVEKLDLGSFQVQKFGTESEYLIRFQNDASKTAEEQNEENEARVTKLSDSFEALVGEGNYDIRRVDSVGPQVGEQLKKNALLAVFYSLLLILIYIGLRFDYEYAPGAVFCLFHDAIVAVGIFALLGHEVNIQILAAVLTLIGYSLNDTIVTFDRIRENRATMKDVSLKNIINLSTNQTLSRTIITNVTTALAVLSLYLFGGGVVADFAFVLGIGLIIGTYSTIYVAAPIMLLGESLKKQ